MSTSKCIGDNNNSDNNNTIWGHCLCNEVVFRFEECWFTDAGQVCICHCAMCRHAIGSTSPVAMALPRTKLCFVEKGKAEEEEEEEVGGVDGSQTTTIATTTKQQPLALKEYRSSKNTRRFFCGTCGCGILFAYDEEPNTIWAYVSTFHDTIQEDPALRKVLADPNITCHIFAKDKPGWFDLHNPDRLPVGDQLELWRVDSCKPTIDDQA